MAEPPKTRFGIIFRDVFGCICARLRFRYALPQFCLPHPPSFPIPIRVKTGIQRENESLTSRLQALSVELEKEKKKTTVVNRPAADAVEEARQQGTVGS